MATWGSIYYLCSMPHLENIALSIWNKASFFFSFLIEERNQAGSSPAMKFEGFKPCMEFLIWYGQPNEEVFVTHNPLLRQLASKEK